MVFAWPVRCAISPEADEEGLGQRWEEPLTTLRWSLEVTHSPPPSNLRVVGTRLEGPSRHRSHRLLTFLSARQKCLHHNQSPGTLLDHQAPVICTSCFSTFKLQ